MMQPWSQRGRSGSTLVPSSTVEVMKNGKGPGEGKRTAGAEHLKCAKPSITVIRKKSSDREKLDRMMKSNVKVKFSPLQEALLKYTKKLFPH